MTLVLAGTFRQYQDWLRTHGLAPTDHRYISSIKSVLGTHAPHYVKVGTWWEREDLDHILEHLRARQAIEERTP